ncbi:MAG TPA: DUF5668 domain-containing protein [Candidatus Dormibacteraeota bacterium]|nr:DUF5668 domain-containing protein [Candidatus Dormibacteraeota bacterium]
MLVLVGVYLLAQNLGFLDWLDWSIFWPVALVILGIWFLLRGRH